MVSVGGAKVMSDLCGMKSNTVQPPDPAKVYTMSPTSICLRTVQRGKKEQRLQGIFYHSQERITTKLKRK